MRPNVAKIAIFVAFFATLFLGFPASAYKCGVQIDTLMEEAYTFSDYTHSPSIRVWPLNIEETDNTDKFNEYAGTVTNPNIVALYLDTGKRIVIHDYRESGLTETQSCAVIVHELCHHLQNVHNTKEGMTTGQREAECYLAQKDYIVNYVKMNWAKKGNPIPLGPNGFQAVKEFKMIQKAKAADQKSDFDPSEYDCQQKSFKYDNVVCQREVKE